MKLFKKLFAKKMTVEQLDKELVIITGLHSWPEIYDSMNEKCNDKGVILYRFSDGIDKFCIKDVHTFHGVMAGVYANEKVDQYSDSIVAYMKSINCLPEVIKNFKYSLKN